jgi:hypothetical protein
MARRMRARNILAKGSWAEMDVQNWLHRRNSPQFENRLPSLHDALLFEIGLQAAKRGLSPAAALVAVREFPCPYIFVTAVCVSFIYR